MKEGTFSGTSLEGSQLLMATGE